MSDEISSPSGEDEILLFGRKTHAKRPRGTVSIQACERCRQRKKKCDGVTPTCSMCLKFGEICVYSNKKRKSNPPPEENVVARVKTPPNLNRVAVVMRYIASFQHENTAFAAVKSSFDYSAASSREKLSSQVLATLFTSMAAIGARFQGAMEDADRLYNQARMGIMQQFDRVTPFVIATHYLQAAHAELQGDFERAEISGTLAEKMAEMWIVKGNPCEAGVDAHSILLASLARKKELTPDGSELVVLNQKMKKWQKIAEDHHWKYQAIRIQTQFCEAVDLLSVPFTSVEEARSFLAAIEGYNNSFQAFISSILNNAYKKRIAMCTAAVRANFALAIEGDAAGATLLADQILQQIYEDISMRDNHTVYNMYILGQLFLRIADMPRFNSITIHLSNISTFNSLALKAVRCLQDLRDSLPHQQVQPLQVLLASDYFDRPTRNRIQSTSSAATMDADASASPISHAVSTDVSSFEQHEAESSTNDVGYGIPMFDEETAIPLLDQAPWEMEQDPLLTLMGEG